MFVSAGQGGGGGGHLFLKGEESWGGSCDEYCSGQFGLGALKVEDLEATLATVSFMDQLGIDAAVLPVSAAASYGSSPICHVSSSCYSRCIYNVV